MKQKNYKIKVNVTFEECNDPISNGVQESKNGGFELNISESIAGSIDDCEQALLHVNSQALRNAISKHLADFSKKKCKSTSNRKL